MSLPHGIRVRRTAAATIVALVVLAVAAVRLSTAGATSIDQLSSQLSQQQAHQQSLSSRIAGLSQLISSLDGQISLVQSREEAVRAELDRDRAALAAARVSLARERALLVVLRARLTRARMLLSRQLVSGYESDRPDVVSVVLNAHGFSDLLEKLDFLHRAQQQQQTIISQTRTAKARADRAARRLAAIEATDRRITQGTALHVGALAGMNALLQSKQSALGQARAAQQSALAASRARGGVLRSEISRLQAQQAAAQAAASASPAQSAGTGSPAQAPGTGAASQSAGSSPAASSGPALGPSGGWAIPYAIVLCESGGQNLPPNSAGASGYYQIVPATWQSFGGSGPAAYLAGKAEQDAVATRIWNGGAGASNWVCAGMVGIH